MRKMFIAALLALSLTNAHAAGLSGFYNVLHLEIDYEPSGDALYARVFLNTGLTLTYKPKDAKDEEALLRLAHLFSEGRSQMAVDVREEKIVRWQLTIR